MYSYEDNKNPCIKKLQLMFPNIQFKIQTLKEDIRCILRAKTIIASIGTFIPSLLHMSENAQKLFKPSYCHKPDGLSIQLICVDLELYFAETKTIKDKLFRYLKMNKMKSEIKKNVNNYIPSILLIHRCVSLI